MLFILNVDDQNTLGTASLSWLSSRPLLTNQLCDRPVVLGNHHFLTRAEFADDFR